jgi:hypothetical protein
MCSAIDSFFQFGILFTAFALEGDGFPMLTVTFNSQCVTDRVKLSGYRKFWLVKEKAEKKLKISITHIHFQIQNKIPRHKKNHFWLMEHSPYFALFLVFKIFTTEQLPNI